MLLGRQEWIQSLLSAIEAGKISSTALGAAQQQRLLRHPDSRIQEKAAKLFAAANADREKVLTQYGMVKDLKGDATKGAAYFEQLCASCHRLQNQGNDVGANLGSVATKPVDYLTTAIFDPNRTVEARYISYTAITKDEVEYTGIILAETANNITVRQAGGKDVTLLRGEIKDLQGGDRSLMPDGFENSLTPQALADLIAFIKTPASIDLDKAASKKQ
jgi:putative heme-binding domain-containing protein